MAKTKKGKRKPDATDDARLQAAAQVESIVEMVDAFDAGRAAYENGKPADAMEEAQQTIREDALSVEVRSGWVTPGSDEMKAEEFCILLCTGGPAVRLVGELDEHNEPRRVWVEYQDWGTPWTHYVGAAPYTDKLLAYCQQFYFGE